jgi:hypothetical protein
MIGAGLALVAAAFCRAQSSPATQHAAAPSLLPDLSRIPDANQRMQMQSQQLQEHNFTALNIERKRQIDQDSKVLLHLATALKAAMDKGDKDVSSSADALIAIEGIEKLARAVKEKMKLSVAVK